MRKNLTLLLIVGVFLLLKNPLTIIILVIASVILYKKIPDFKQFIDNINNKLMDND